MIRNNVSESNRARILRLFAPDPRVKKMLAAALFVPGLLAGCFLGIILTLQPSKTDMSNAEAGVFLMAIIVLPLAAILLSLTALREPHHPPRALMWLGAALSIFTAGLIVTVMMALDEGVSDFTPLIFLLLAIAPAALILSMPAIYSIAKTVPELRAALNSAAEERALAYIGTRGAVSFDELSRLAGIPRDAVDNTVDALLGTGRLSGTLDAVNGMIFSAAYLAEQQRQLLEWVNLRGKVQIEDLARLLKTNSATVTDWIYQMVQRGQFGGYVNWRKGTVYADAGKQIGADSQCPECGGALAPGGGQRIVCLHCGTEMWVRSGDRVAGHR